LGFMSDTWALGMAGRQPVSNVLDLAEHVQAGASPELWQEVAGIFASLNHSYKGDTVHQAALRKFAIARLAPEFQRIGWDAKPGESGPVKLLRTQLIGTLASMDDPAVLAKARAYFANPTSIPAELRKTIYGIVAEHADAATWEQLHAQAKAETTPLIKARLYQLLATSQDEALTRKALAMALTSEPGATTAASMIRTASFNFPDLTFDFAVAHREQVADLVDPSGAARFFPSLGAGSNDPAMIGKIQAYAKAHIAAGSRRVADTAIASIRYRQMIREKRLPAVTTWLQQHGN